MAISVSKLSKKRLGDWVVNPYIGCEHGCKHCYCPGMPGVKLFNNGHTQREWGNYLIPKPNWIERLKQDLAAFPREGSRAGRGYVLCSFLTDCYTPAEAHYKRTRQTLELLLAAGCHVRVQTRSALVERDFDLLIKHKTQVLLGTSLPYLDDKLARVLEPKASAPTRRLEMIRKARLAGIEVYVAIAPFMPFHGAPELAEVIGAIKDVRPNEIFCEVLNPRSVNLEMMNEAFEAAGRPEQIKADYREHWARFTYILLKAADVECQRAGLGHVFIAWPDPVAARSKSLDEAERTWLQRWLPAATEMEIPKTVRSRVRCADSSAQARGACLAASSL